MTTRPEPTEYAPYYEKYVSLVPETEILGVLDRQIAELKSLISAVPADREQYRYGEGKWSVREVLGHLTDGERIFGWRAFCFSRGEKAPLPSFDENVYVAESGYGRQSLAVLLQEFETVRRSNLSFLRQLDDTRWVSTGTASGKTVSVRALAYMMVGHVRHHVSILQGRYGLTG
jgi:uncharacterized damage-inducible protein DinB